MSIPDYTKYRDVLLDGGWMTAVFDSERNMSVYKPTIKGTGIYSVIVKLTGRDSLVNGYKLNIKDIEYMKLEEGSKTDELIKVLLDNDILSKSYNPETNVEKYELTTNGAKLMIAFFVSNNRQVDTLPGDTLAKITEIIGNVPRYSLKFCEIMNNIAKGFQAFDNLSPQQTKPQQTKPRERVSYKKKYSNKKWNNNNKYNNKKKKQWKKTKTTYQKRKKEPWEF